MALAHISPIDGSPGERRFAVDLGSNLWWRIAVGSEEYRDTGGARLLADPHWISGLQGPLPPHALGRATIAVEEKRFDRDNRFVQIMTYRDEQGNGPAVSTIVESRSAGLPRDGLPPIQFSVEERDRGHQATTHAFGHTAQGLHPGRWQVARHSSQMAFPAIPAIIGAVGPLLAKAAPVLKAALPQLANMVAPIAGQLLQQVVGGIGGGGATAGPPPAIPMPQPPAAPVPQRPAAQPAPKAPQPVAPPAAPAPQAQPGIGDIQTVALLLERLTELAAANREGRSRSSSYSHYGTSTALRRRYAAMASRRSRLAAENPDDLAQGMAVPVAALMPLLTKLAPMLEKVLTPETVKAVLNAPNEHLQTVFNGVKDVAKLGIESHEQDLQFLRDINPGVDDPALDSLLAGLSVAASQPDPGRDWKRSESVDLTLPAIRTVPVAGQMTTLLASDRPLRFPLHVVLPTDAQGRSPTLRDAVIQLQVKDGQSLEVLLQEEWEAGAVTASGPLARVPTVAAAALAGLPRNSDLLFCFALIWSNSRGEARGAPVHHMARLSEGYSFERLVPSQSGVVERLGEEARFGDYQHIVWTNRLRDDARRVVGELTYFFALAEDDMPLHRRLEPSVASRGQEMKRSTREVQVESGFEVSLDALLKLGSILDPSVTPIDPAMRAALADMNLRNFFDRSGRVSFDFRGAPDDVFTLKTIPTFAMHDLVFRRASGIDEFGQIIGQEDVVAALPVPIAIDVEVRDPSASPGSGPITTESAELVPTKMLRRYRKGEG